MSPLRHKSGNALDFSPKTPKPASMIRLTDSMKKRPHRKHREVPLGGTSSVRHFLQIKAITNNFTTVSWLYLQTLRNLGDERIDKEQRP